MAGLSVGKKNTAAKIALSKSGASGVKCGKYGREISNQRLLWIDAQHFYAGSVWEKINNEWVCVEAAPIINWIKRKKPEEVKKYLTSKRYSWGWL